MILGIVTIVHFLFSMNITETYKVQLTWKDILDLSYIV